MAPQSDARTLSDYEKDFVRILKNESKFESSPSFPPRKHGFVVLAREGSNLKPLQNLCAEQVVSHRNPCITARYRLQPKAGIATLLVAFLSDLDRLRRRREARHADSKEPVAEVAGDLWPEPSPAVPVDGSKDLSTWATDLETYVDRVFSAEADLSERLRGSNARGILRSEQLSVLLRTLEESKVLKSGDRLVLFGELSEEATNPDDWKPALEILINQLPERVGIVFSGAPKNLKLDLPDKDPHFLELTVPNIIETAPAQFVYRYTDSSFHSDVPAAKDELDVNRYASAIARFVLHPQTSPPITIGIHGPWGKGKSSFMQLIDSAIVKYAEANRAANTQKWNDLATKLIKAEAVQAYGGDEQLSDNEKDRRTIEYEGLREEEHALWEEMKEAAEKNVLPIWFNAWQFQDAKQTWAGLASVITERMESLLPRRARQWLKLKYAWKERKAELILNVLLPFGIFCVIALLFALGLFRGVIVPKQDSGIAGLLQLIVPTGSIFITIWFFSSQFVKVAQPVSERVLSYMAMPTYRDQMGFQHRVRDDVKFVYEFLTTRLNTSSFNRAGKFRVVVYIDDLDRCSEDKIMELLQAINLILADCKFFVFVGMDTEMIYRAIKAYFKDNVDDRFADNYLSKVIQISFYLPDTRLQTRAGYLSTLFSLSSRLELAARVTTNGSQAEAQTDGPIPTTAVGELSYDLSQLLKIVPVQVKETEDTSHELQTFSDYCDFIDDNPREMKRLINIHRLIKILVQNPNTSLETDRQKKLVKWLIFCDTWPQLVGHILNGPGKTGSQNCLLDLAKSLQEKVGNPTSTEPVPDYDGLEDFAVYVRSFKKDGLSPAAIQAEEKRMAEEKKVYALSAADIDDDFRLAAKLSQMVRKPARRT
jgi:hypothetical protein